MANFGEIDLIVKNECAICYKTEELNNKYP